MRRNAEGIICAWTGGGHRTTLLHPSPAGSDAGRHGKRHVCGNAISHHGEWYNAAEGFDLERELRRLQRLGTASLGISIPKEWAKARGFRAGSLLNLTMSDDGNIVISPSEAGVPAFPADCTIHADSCPDAKLILRTIIGCYVVGYSTIRVVSSEELTGEQNENVRLAVEMLTGVTVVEQSDRHILLEIMIQPPNYPMMSMIRRLYSLSSLMVERTLDSMFSPETNTHTEILRMESDIDRLYRLILRLLLLSARDRDLARQIGITDMRHLLGDRAISASLEFVGDLCEELVLEFAEVPPQKEYEHIMHGKVGKLSAMFHELSTSTSSCLFEHDLNAASQALDSVLLLERECWSGMKTIRGSEMKRGSAAASVGKDETCRYSLLFSSIRNIAKEYELLVQVMMNRFIEAPNPKFPYLEIGK
ncbi:MAG: hypothetical protein KIY10_04975 [Thermoplasmata archaeon]|nr:hypothetical protein [Candidatus Sysuiplasma jiujiangense]